MMVDFVYHKMGIPTVYEHIVVSTTFSQAAHSRVNRMTALSLFNEVPCPPGWSEILFNNTTNKMVESSLYTRFSVCSSQQCSGH